MVTTDRSDVGLGAPHTLRDLNGLAAELRSAVLVGVVNLASTEWCQPLDADGRWFVAPRAFVGRSNPDLVLAGVPLADDTFTDGAFRVRLEVDTVDSPALPSRGTNLLLDGGHAGGSSAGDFDSDRTDVLDRLRQGGSVFLAADTPVGAVLVGRGP